MKRTLTFSSDTEKLAGMRHEVREFLNLASLDEMQAELVVLALDEACTNIIRYAYQGRPNCPIELTLELSESQIRCEIRDYGTPCDPDCIKGRELEDFQPGGLGVRIMQFAFDEVDYRPCERGTVLTLTKNLPPNPLRG